MEDKNYRVEITYDKLISYMNNSPIGYMVIDRDGFIIEINDLLLKASKYSLEEIINKKYDEFIFYERTEEEFFEKLNSFKPNILFSLSWRDIDGKLHISKVFIWKVKNDSSIFVIGFLEINTEKQSSLLSRFAENFVLENNIGLILINEKLNICEISPLACKLLNVEKKEVINKVIDKVFVGIPDEHRIVQRTLLDGITVTNYAVTWVINQQRYDLLIDSNVIRDEEGVVIGAYVVFKDVSNMRALEQQVHQNDRLKTLGQIAAGTAHEIRNPLTSIKGFLQILKGSLMENKLINELKYTDIMLSEIERINKLVNEILLLSKPKDIQYAPTNVNQVLKEILPIIDNEALLHSVEVNIKIDKSIPLVIGDGELLKQVFLNLAKNGIEAMAGGGRLSISTMTNGKTRNIDISIRDSGPGIPNYIIDKIFDPFFTTKETGTGLGLSICQKIIHDINGHIRISSKGFGTVFIVSIPYI